MEPLYYVTQTFIASVTNKYSCHFLTASCFINMLTTHMYTHTHRTHKSGPLFTTLVEFEVYDTAVPRPSKAINRVITLTKCQAPSTYPDHVKVRPLVRPSPHGRTLLVVLQPPSVVSAQVYIEQLKVLVLRHPHLTHVHPALLFLSTTRTFHRPPTTTELFALKIVRAAEPRIFLERRSLFSL